MKLPLKMDEYGYITDENGDCPLVSGFALSLDSNTKAELNDKFIVRAVNSHDALVEALEACLEWIDAVPSETPLPAMPGFDRDDVDILIAAAKGEDQ